MKTKWEESLLTEPSGNFPIILFRDYISRKLETI